MAWMYVGEKSRVTPCEYLNYTEVTSDGVGSACNWGCPGLIDGKCRFTHGEPIFTHRELFIWVEE